MKKIIILFCSLAFILSCSKNNGYTPINGKWYLLKKVVWTTSNSGYTQKDTTIGHSNEYVDFRADGKEYSSYWSGTKYQCDTFRYRVSTNILHTSKGIYSGTTDIQTLTSTNLTFHTRAIDSFGNYDFWFFYVK